MGYPNVDTDHDKQQIGMTLMIDKKPIKNTTNNY